MIGVPAPLASLFPDGFPGVLWVEVVRMANEHPMGHWFLRVVTVSIVWVAFAAIGFGLYATFIHDVGATYWVMQVFLLPVALPIVVLFDRLLSKQELLSGRFGFVTVLDCGFAILLWLWPLGAMVLLGAFSSFRLLQFLRSRTQRTDPKEKS